MPDTITNFTAIEAQEVQLMLNDKWKEPNFSKAAVCKRITANPKCTSVKIKPIPIVPSGNGFQIEKAIKIEKKDGRICGRSKSFEIVS